MLLASKLSSELKLGLYRKANSGTCNSVTNKMPGNVFIIEFTCVGVWVFSVVHVLHDVSDEEELLQPTTRGQSRHFGFAISIIYIFVNIYYIEMLTIYCTYIVK